MMVSAVKCVLLGMVSVSPAARSQVDGAALLHRAVHCLGEKGFLPHTLATELTIGYLLDEKSYPAARMLYVVVFASHSRPDGVAFTMFLTEHGERSDFNIQNNARFKLLKEGDGGVSFEAPPLGGTWTQEHLVSAIKQIGKQPRFTMSDTSMRTADSSVNCEAYTDPQPKPTPK